MAFLFELACNICKAIRSHLYSKVSVGCFETGPRVADRTPPLETVIAPSEDKIESYYQIRENYETVQSWRPDIVRYRSTERDSSLEHRGIRNRIAEVCRLSA